MNPKVSVITPVYNAEKYLNECIESVLNQTMNDLEMILINDCSTDNSLEILKSYTTRDSRVKVINLHSNSGSGVARNTGIEHAIGRYIAFLDSDDIWVENKLEIQIGLMESNAWDFSHSSYGYLNSDGSPMDKVFHVSKDPVDYKHLLKRTEISCLTAVYNSDALGKHYMTQHRRKQDYALWLSILKKGVVSHPIPDVLAYYRQTPNSATSNKWALISKHVAFLRETQNLGWFPSLYYTGRWMINGLMRYYIK